MATVVNASGQFGQNAGRRLQLATARSVKEWKVTNKVTTWPEFVAQLAEPVRTKESYKEYRAAAKADQDSIKDVGYYVPAHFKTGRRKKVNMDSRDMLTLDIDFAEPDYLGRIKDLYGSWAYALHSTHKHCPEQPRLRLVFPLSRGVAEDEYQAIGRKIASLLDIDWFDDTTYDFARVMHWPSVSCDAEYVFEANPGAFLSVDDVLAMYADWRDVTSWPISSRQTQRPHKPASKAEDPRLKKGVVGAFCRAYNIDEAIAEWLPGVYQPAEDGSGRYTYAGGTTTNGAIVYDGGDFLFSHHGTDPVCNQLVNSFDLVRLHLFGNLDDKAAEDTPVNKKPSYIAMSLRAREDKKVLAELSADLADELARFDSVDEPGAAEDDLGLEDTSAITKPEKVNHKDWLRELKRSDNGTLRVTLMNICAILRNDPVFKGSVALNESTHDLEQRKTLGSRVVPAGGSVLWTDAADLQVKYRLEQVYDLEVSTSMVAEAVTIVGEEHSYHPIRDYLHSVEAKGWDGVPRVETLFIDYLGTPDNPYNRAVARKMLAAMVARIFTPGCKFDYMAILEGAQGLRKSTFIQTLCKDWFTDSLPAFDKARDCVDAMRGKWGAEIAELHTFSASDIETTRAFLSRQVDRTRLAYDRRAVDFPREFVLWGSTNDTFDYLRDPKGNRRFWPIRVCVEKIDIEGLKRNIDQIWAEAVAIVRAGETLYLPPDLEALAAVEQTAREVVDDLTGMVLAWLEEEVPEDYLSRYKWEDGGFSDAPMVKRDKVCALQVWEEVLGGARDKYTKAEARRINILLAKLPGVKGPVMMKFGKRYGVQRGFEVL